MYIQHQHTINTEDHLLTFYEVNVADERGGDQLQRVDVLQATQRNQMSQSRSYLRTLINPKYEQ